MFQRTANFSIPARNAALTRGGAAEVSRQLSRDQALCARGGAATASIPRCPIAARSTTATTSAARNTRRAGIAAGSPSCRSTTISGWTRRPTTPPPNFVREKIAEIVKDPETAKLLQPNNHPIGSKRICIDTDYFATFNRPNVTLVDIKSNPIEEITANAVRVGGKDYEVDALVLATGFDAMTGSVAKIDISGRDGQTLNQKWVGGPTHLSRPDERRLSQSLRHHRPRQPVGAVEHDRLDRAACRLDQPTASPTCATAASTPWKRAVDAEDKWVAHVNEVAYTTLYPQANSWYMGANVPGKPRIFMPYIGGVGPYRQICNDVAAKGYEGFVMDGRGARRGRWRRRNAVLRRVGKAKRAHHSFTIADRWWARRKCAFAHPTISPAAAASTPQQTGRHRPRHCTRAATRASVPDAVRHRRLRLPVPRRGPPAFRP